MCQEQSWLLLLHMCDVGLTASWLSTLLGPMAKLVVVGGAVGDASAGATLGTSFHPIEGGDSPFFPSPWQDSHCSRVRCSFPPTVIGPERGCGSSPSTTLRRPIASSINIVERSRRDSIERAICLYFLGMHRKSFSTALSSP
jgi:hypothetical protein